METDWITVNQAATLSGFHREYLRDLLRHGKIEGKKFGSAWMVSKASLTAYMQEAKDSGDNRRGPQNAS